MNRGQAEGADEKIPSVCLCIFKECLPSRGALFTPFVLSV